MIRNFNRQDIDQIMELWLDVNILAHSFITRAYWESNYEAVKATLPSATVFVLEENKRIQGFIGLLDNDIAGIFVSSHCQSQGIGKQLLNYAKMKKDALTLCVYKENNRAVRFYIREQFTILNEQMDEHTGEIEYHMLWIKDK